MISRLFNASRFLRVGAPRHLVVAIAAALPMTLAAAVGVAPSAPAAPAPAGAAQRVVQMRVRAAVQRLPVARETPAGYDRRKYRHWIDADGDCRDTRDEVLAAESRTKVSGCDITTGRWLSYYDRATWTRSADVDIDHLVPLKESWDSGAKRWSSGTRTRYANDLADPRSLVAVTDSVNQSKSDRDPAEWMPTYGTCRYVREWAAVKIRWNLRVDRAEKVKLAEIARGCPNVRLTVAKARVVRRHGTGAGAGHPGSGALDPRFSYCYQAIAAGYGPYRQGRDPEYAWYTDADHDGIVCE